MSVRSWLDHAIKSANNHGMLNWMSDTRHLKTVFRAQLGYKLDLDDPRTFNEKLQWLKLYDRREEYRPMVDKYAVRDYIAQTIGSEYLIPCYGVWDDPDEIDFAALPDSFVLKCTHDSGSVIICKNKSDLDVAAAKAYLKKHSRRSGFAYGREWPYKGLKPRIIAEELMQDDAQNDLWDYKIHCFAGDPKLILVCSERHKSGLKEDWFTPEWEHQPIQRPTHHNAEQAIPRPERLEEMLRLARVLAAGIPFVRVDFYQVNGRVYFGEITFFPTSGFTAFVPQEYDRILGDWIPLPVKQ